MSTDDKLTPDEISAIIEHNTRLIAGTEKVLAKLLLIPHSSRNDQAKELIRYHRNVLSALKWSNKVAEQRIQYGAKLNGQ